MKEIEKGTEFRSFYDSGEMIVNSSGISHFGPGNTLTC